MKRILFFILTAFSVAATAQTTISGRVTDSQDEALEGCIVAALTPADSSIVGYSMTDSVGRYRISLEHVYPRLLLRLTGFNIKRAYRNIEGRTQRIDWKAEEENMVLREVQVKAQKLWGSRDTLNYLVSAYMKDYDRTIGDVLKELPGISIEENGTIKYQGVAINHFYIEGMDVLQGRYNLATSGIKAEDVATVQVLEHHEHVRALQDQIPPESAAINLKLKKKVKGVWTHSIHLGGGIQTPQSQTSQTQTPQPPLGGAGNVQDVETSGLNQLASPFQLPLAFDLSQNAGDGGSALWDCDAYSMNFGTRGQHVIFYGNGNTGNGSTLGERHYGGIGASAYTLTGVLGASRSPIGSNLRDNLHNLYTQNLRKLNETTQLHYNASYKYDLQRLESYARTSYTMPDGTQLLMTEDASSRQRQHHSEVELQYELNADKRYLSNTLNWTGEWNDGWGTTLTTSDRIRQDARNRVMGLSDRLHWVHRTASGGGFDMSSTASFSRNPQSLAVTDGMTAMQDATLTSARFSTHFSTLKNLTQHRWSITPTASLSTQYMGIESELLHPEVSQGLLGDMHYTHSALSAGATARYVKGGLSLSFDLPLVLGYTTLNNVPYPGEDTDARRLQLQVAPEAALLWRMHDNWTLHGDASYGASENGWSQMLTSYIMSNYRSLNRYKAHIYDSHSLDGRLKLDFKEIFAEVFAYLEARAGRNWSDVMYGSTLDAQGHSVMQAELVPHHSTSYTLNANLRKDINWQTLSLEVNGGYARSNSQYLRQGIVTQYQGDTYSVTAKAGIDLWKGAHLAYDINWSNTLQHSSVADSRISSYRQHASLDVTLLTNRIFLHVNGSHIHNAQLPGRSDYGMMDAKLRLKLWKPVEIEFTASNLLGTRTFVTHQTTDMVEHYAEYHLRPRSFLASVRFNLGKK
ncbi:MAG: TonB-dependent receptor [Bacteroidales bacterium]|nr:TonB-dependent receptor [Bacteroidales bacterium]